MSLPSLPIFPHISQVQWGKITHVYIAPRGQEIYFFFGILSGKINTLILFPLGALLERQISVAVKLMENI
jgi:hypothetical protein